MVGDSNDKTSKPEMELYAGSQHPITVAVTAEPRVSHRERNIEANHDKDQRMPHGESPPFCAVSSLLLGGATEPTHSLSDIEAGKLS